MGNVVQFKPVFEELPHGTGEAFCLQCGAEWIAVVPAGTVNFECPQCHTEKGLMKLPYAPPSHVLVRQCNCGNQFFWITPEGHLCPNCGIYQSY